MVLQAYIDNIFSRFCYGGRDGDEKHVFLDFSSLLNGNKGEIDKVCEQIEDFANNIISDIKTIDETQSHTGRTYINNPRTHRHQVGAAQFDSTHNSLYPVCKTPNPHDISKKDLEGNPEYKCQKLHPGQPNPKRFIAQLHHIVSEIGVLLPMGVYNMDDIRNTGGVVKHPLSHRMTETEELDFVRDDWDTFNSQMRLVNIFGKTPEEYKTLATQISSSHDVTRVLGNAIFQLSITQDVVDKLVKRMNTVLKLRMIDVRICNVLKLPIASDNRIHKNFYEQIYTELKSSLMKRVSDHNLLVKEGGGADIVIGDIFNYSIV